MTDVLIKRWPCEDRHTGRTLCDNEGKDWNAISASQGKPKLPANH